MGLLDSLKQMFAGGAQGNLQRIDLSKRFELLGKSNQGSMSRVFAARDRQTGRMCCVKVLDKEKTAKFEERFAGLNRPTEGVISLALQHKNIVRTFEHGLTLEGEQFLVMERIDGVGLNFLIETRDARLQGKRPDCLAQMADGLEYIHKQGYLHRDICPRNFMVAKDGVVKYIDFGLTIPYRPEFCKPGNRTGTADYLAPEIIKRLKTDHRVDLFALGVTAYEMITGELPWEKAQTQQALLNRVNTPGRDPREVVEDLDETTARFLVKAIERDPAARFQTAAEFREAAKKLPKNI